MAAPIAKNKVGAIGSGGASGERRQLTRMRRARASAYSLQAKIFRASRAIGLVATSFSPLRMTIRTSDFAAWSAAWLCVASWTVKGVIRGVVGACVVSA
jgi:hypothetical protein